MPGTVVEISVYCGKMVPRGGLNRLPYKYRSGTIKKEELGHP